MHKCIFLSACFLAFVSFSFAGVTVSSPGNGTTVQSPVHFAAEAGYTSCSKGVASMGIYKAPGVLAYTTNGTSLSTNLDLSPGTYNTTIQQWDYCGGASKAYITITVSSSTGVHITAPTSSTVGSPVHFAATATTACSKCVAAMGSYTSPYTKAYTVAG